MTLDLDAFRRLLRVSRQDGEIYAQGGAFAPDLERLRLSVKDVVERWAPDSQAADAADLERLGRAHNEAAVRLLGYRAQRLGSLVNVAGLGAADSGALPGLGPSEMLYSGAASVLAPWHPLDVGAIE